MYDDAGGAYAARAWWMFRWVGHAHVAVLNGGLQAWRDTGVTLAEGVENASGTTNFAAKSALTKTIDTPGMLDLIEAHAPPRLLDARAEARWAGREEPIDPVAGHIPGALCRPFQANMDDQGKLKSAAQLRAEFTPLVADGDVVCYCGSGVTAAHNVLAMRIAGFAEPTLYADSWSGWITDASRPIATA